MMSEVIGTLMDEAPKMTDASGKPDLTQAPAVTCHVMLRGQLQPLHGVLSYYAYQDRYAAHGNQTMRMLTPAQVSGEGGRPREALLESFFSMADILSIMVEREVKPIERSRIQLA